MVNDDHKYQSAILPYWNTCSWKMADNYTTGHAAMITAIVFVKADVASIPEVAAMIAALDGVSEVYSSPVRSTSSRWFACGSTTRSPTYRRPSQAVPGVKETRPHRLRPTPSTDLEAAFSIWSDKLVLFPWGRLATRTRVLPWCGWTHWAGSVQHS